MAYWLLDRFRKYGSKEAVIHDGTATSYADLLDFYDNWRSRLEKAGVPQGAVVALVGDFSVNTVSAFLAIERHAGIVVPLTTSNFKNHPEFLETAGVQYIITGEDIRPCSADAAHPLVLSLADRGLSGLVLFSSGSTGKCKAALHVLGPLMEKFRTRRFAQRTLTFLLLDHIGGINTFLHVLSNGGTIVSIADRSPEGVCGTIAETGVEVLPVSPTFLNLCLLSGAYKRHDMSSLKKITYGTEPMPLSTLERLNEAFPGVTMQQTYGLSELGILRSKSLSNGSLWVKIGGEGYKTKVIDGILWIKADSAMLGYLNAPSPFDDEGWFNTKDVVETKDEYFRILGRDSEIINVGGEKVFPAEVESYLLELDNILDATVIGAPNALSGQMVVARVTLQHHESAPMVKKRIRNTLKNSLAPHKVPQKVIVTKVVQYNERFKRMRLPAVENAGP